MRTQIFSVHLFFLLQWIDLINRGVGFWHLLYILFNKLCWIAWQMFVLAIPCAFPCQSSPVRLVFTASVFHPLLPTPHHSKSGCHSLLEDQGPKEGTHFLVSSKKHTRRRGCARNSPADNKEGRLQEWFLKPIGARMSFIWGRIESVRGEGFIYPCRGGYIYLRGAIMSASQHESTWAYD